MYSDMVPFQPPRGRGVLRGAEGWMELDHGLSTPAWAGSVAQFLKGVFELLALSTPAWAGSVARPLTRFS